MSAGYWRAGGGSRTARAPDLRAVEAIGADSRQHAGRATRVQAVLRAGRTAPKLDDAGTEPLPRSLPGAVTVTAETDTTVGVAGSGPPSPQSSTAATFHDLRHTHETLLIEEHVPRIMRLVRLGHKRQDVDDIYSHVTDQMIEETLQALQQRWEQDGGWTCPESAAVA